MSWLEALILGIVQGLTEFLPVSSSGHLEIGQALLGTSGEENLTFAIIVHTATVLSTLCVLWHEVTRLYMEMECRERLRGEDLGVDDTGLHNRYVLQRGGGGLLR